MQQDFKLETVVLEDDDLGSAGPTPAIPAYQWQDTGEDDQKEAYMAYIRGVIPLDEDTDVC